MASSGARSQTPQRVVHSDTGNRDQLRRPGHLDEFDVGRHGSASRGGKRAARSNFAGFTRRKQSQRLPSLESKGLSAEHPFAFRGRPATERNGRLSRQSRRQSGREAISRPLLSPSVPVRQNISRCGQRCPYLGIETRGPHILCERRSQCGPGRGRIGSTITP